MQLTTSQLAAIEALHTELLHPSRGGFPSLIGGGGVGKTTSIFSLINKLVNEDGFKVLLCAPTHKACNVLRQTQARFGDSTPVITLASALGFKQLPEDGKKKFRVAGEGKMEAYGVVIVDEASQIGRAAVAELRKQSMEHGTLIIGLGDDCQLPPTKEFASPLFESGKLIELTEVIRYTGDVLVLATDLRKHIKASPAVLYDIRNSLPTESEDIFQFTDKDLFLASAIAAVDPKDPDASKILAWRNATVQRYNRQVHEAIHGTDAPEYVIGDIILPQAPVILNKKILANTDDACEVLDYGTAVEDLLGAGKVFIEKNIFTVRSLRTSDVFTFAAVSEKDFILFQQAMNEIAQMCRKGDIRWSVFYDLDERLTTVRHPYASTVHKAQGSTYTNNFMDISDILACRQAYVTNRLLYTGLTRSNKLNVLL